MPRTLGGLFAFVLSAVLATLIGTLIINRVAFLRRLANGAPQA